HRWHAPPRPRTSAGRAGPGVQGAALDADPGPASLPQAALWSGPVGLAAALRPPLQPRLLAPHGPGTPFDPVGGARRAARVDRTLRPAVRVRPGRRRLRVPHRTGPGRFRRGPRPAGRD